MKLKGAIALTLFAISAVAVPPAQAASSRADYAVQADPICKSAGKDIVRLWMRFRRAAKQYPFKIQAAANALERIGSRYSSAIRSLGLIAPPPGDEAVISQWLDLHRRAAAKYPLAASAYRLNDYRRLNRLIGSADRLQGQAKRLVSYFPFQQCA